MPSPSFMVAEHLLLPDTATRRDLTDEDLILDVAASVGTPERLRALVLLAEADALATGPAAWTAWRRTLLDELVTRVERVLERGDMGEELAARLTDRVQRVRDLLADEPDADVDRFVFRMPRGYFLAVEPAQVARHYRAIAPPLGLDRGPHGGRRRRPRGHVRAPRRRARPARPAQPDRRRARARRDLDPVGAGLHHPRRRRGRPVRGRGRVRPRRSPRRDGASSARRSVARSKGSISLERRVEDKRRHYPAPKVQTPVTLRVDNDASDFSTVIEVGAPDRIGLLHDMTLAFAELAVDVHVAKVATFDGRVVDAFYVRDPLGRKITDRERLAEIEEAVRERLTAP